MISIVLLPLGKARQDNESIPLGMRNISFLEDFSVGTVKFLE